MTSFVKDVVSWDELRSLHKAARERTRETPNFKSWLAKRGGVRFDDEAILHAVRELPAPPEELEQLMSALELISATSS